MKLNSFLSTNIREENLKPLSDKAFYSLLLSAKQGDEEARDKIVYSNLRLVISLAQELPTSSTNDIDDFVQVGLIGLLKAIDKYDISKNCKFSTYATHTILGEMKNYKRDTVSIRVREISRRRLKSILEFQEEFFSKYYREPNIDEIREYFNISKDDVKEALASFSPIQSMHLAITNPKTNESFFISDTLRSESDTESEIISECDTEKVHAVINALPAFNREVIKLRFGFYGKKYSQYEIATLFKTNQRKIFEAEKRSLKTMKIDLKRLEKMSLKEYLKIKAQINPLTKEDEMDMDILSEIILQNKGKKLTDHTSI